MSLIKYDGYTLRITRASTTEVLEFTFDDLKTIHKLIKKNQRLVSRKEKKAQKARVVDSLLK